MTHQVTTQDLLGYSFETHLCASISATKASKKLIIQCKVNLDGCSTSFVVLVNNIPEYVGNHLESAISVYNSF